MPSVAAMPTVTILLLSLHIISRSSVYEMGDATKLKDSGRPELVAR